MAEELKANQRKEWAKLMYLKENITQQEIADRVGVSRVTVNKWVKEWEGLKLNLLQTREERISSTLTQLDELDRSIAGIRDIYTVSRGLLDWLRQQDLERAKELSDYFDAYIKEKMKWVK